MTLITTLATQLSRESVKKIIQLGHAVTPFMMKKGLMEKLINSLLGLDITGLNIRIALSLNNKP